MKIEFTDTLDGKRLYAVVCMGWIKGGELRGKEQLMLGVNIQKKLSDIGEWTDSAIEMAKGPQTIELTRREFDLLRAHCEAADFHVSWGTEALRMFTLFEEMLNGHP